MKRSNNKISDSSSPTDSGSDSEYIEHTTPQKKRTLSRRGSASTIKLSMVDESSSSEQDRSDSSPKKGTSVFKKEEPAPLPDHASISDNFSRLFQITSQGCACVCFINNKIFITDNHLTRSQEGSKMNLINNLREYFAEVKPGSLPESRNKIFMEAAKKRIKGEAEGYVNLSDTDIENIVNKVLHTPKNSSINIAEERTSGGGRKYRLEASVYVAAAQQITRQIKHDFQKIEKFLQASENQDHGLTKAFRQKDNVGRINIEYYMEETNRDKACISLANYDKANDLNPGCYTIYVANRDKGKPIHAEVQMADFLLITDTLQKAKEPIYLGISKLCCFGCANTIQACNNYKKESIKTVADEREVTYNSYLLKRGAHNIDFGYSSATFLNSSNSKKEGSRYYSTEGDGFLKQMNNATTLEGLTATYFQSKEAEQILIGQDVKAAVKIQKELAVIDNNFKKLLNKKAISKETIAKGTYMQQYSDSDSRSEDSTLDSKLLNQNKLQSSLAFLLKHAPDEETKKVIMGLTKRFYTDTKLEQQEHLISNTSQSKILLDISFALKNPTISSDVLLDKVIGDGNCGFYAVLGYKNKETFDRNQEVVKPLLDNLEKENIRKYVEIDIKAFYQEHINDQEKPHAFPHKVWQFFKDQQAKGESGDTIIDKIPQENKAEFLKGYVEYFSSSKDIWPTAEGILSAFADLKEIKMHCWKIEENHNIPSLRYHSTNDKQDNTIDYKSTVHIVHNRAGDHFDILKEKFVPLVTPYIPTDPILPSKHITFNELSTAAKHNLANVKQPDIKVSEEPSKQIVEKGQAATKIPKQNAIRPFSPSGVWSNILDEFEPKHLQTLKKDAISVPLNSPQKTIPSTVKPSNFKGISK